MKQYKNIKTITFSWKRAGGKDIKEEHVEALKETAEDRILSMMKKGYTSGELSDNIYMSDDDGQNGVEYFGQWEVKEVTP